MFIFSHRPQGCVFKISNSRSPFLSHKGDIVTIEYDSLQKRNQYPIDPVIVRKRDDLNWDDVVKNSTQAISTSKIGNNKREILKNFAKGQHLLEIGLKETKFPQVRSEYTQNSKHVQQIYYRRILE